MTDGGLIVKPGAIPKFYRHCPKQFLPDRIVQFKKIYACYLEPGRTAKAGDVQRILDIGREYLWTGKVSVPKNLVSAYVGRTRVLARQYVPSRWHGLIDDAVWVIDGAKLCRARVVHGDLTLENIVIESSDRLVFINPAYSSVSTGAVDRAALLQSIVMMWEKRGWAKPGDWPEWADQVDWAFLVTRWVGLIPEWPRLYLFNGFKALKNLKP